MSHIPGYFNGNRTNRCSLSLSRGSSLLRFFQKQLGVTPLFRGTKSLFDGDSFWSGLRRRASWMIHVFARSADLGRASALGLASASPPWWRHAYRLGWPMRGFLLVGAVVRFDARIRVRVALHDLCVLRLAHVLSVVDRIKSRDVLYGH